MKLSKFVVFAASSESKLAEQWAAIEKRVRARARRPLTGVVIGSIALAAAVALVFVLQRRGSASSALVADTAAPVISDAGIERETPAEP